MGRGGQTPWGRHSYFSSLENEKTPTGNLKIYHEIQYTLITLLNTRILKK